MTCIQYEHMCICMSLLEVSELWVVLLTPPTPITGLALHLQVGILRQLGTRLAAHGHGSVGAAAAFGPT